MASKAVYRGGYAEYEDKLKRVMERLGVERYTYDWSRSGCYISLICRGRAFRFEKTLDRARELGERITRVSDLFAQIVLMLEDLARAAERGIYDFATIISGLPSLPEAMAEMPQCYIALGFAELPKTEEEVKAQYRRLAKVMHPDAGGDAEAFRALRDNYTACLEGLGNV